MAENRSKAARADSEAKIAKWALVGNMTQYEMAEKLGVAQSTVSRDFKRVMKRWQDSAISDIDQIMTMELQTIQMMISEVYEEWQKSKTPTVRKVIESDKKGGKMTRLETTDQCGDPRLVNNLIALLERRAKLTGIDKPSRVTLTEDESKTIDTSSLSQSAMAEILAARDKLNESGAL